MTTDLLLGNREYFLKSKFAAAKSFIEYSFAFVLSSLLSLSILDLWNLNLLKYPLIYRSDAVGYAMMTKSVISTGWYLRNPAIGVPDGQFMFDIPQVEGVNFLILKLIALFSSNWALVNNVFYLLGFPLVTVSALFVLRRFGLKYPLALTAALLYSLLPFHFLRLDHLSLSAYFLVPFAVWFAGFVYKDELFKSEEGGMSKRKKAILFLLYLTLCALIGSSGIYYAFFSSFFILVAGVVSCCFRRRLVVGLNALLFVSVISGAVIANTLPSIMSNRVNGNNLEVVRRIPFESEFYGLKIIQLLYPSKDHRISKLANIRKEYDESRVTINENHMTT